MNLSITPRPLAGTVTPPPSKSLTHRLLIADALTGNQSILHHLADSRDIQATRRCLQALFSPSDDLPRLDCGESGSTLRFLLPLALVLRGSAVFTGQGRLLDRPLGPYESICREQSISFRREKEGIFVEGNLSPGIFSLPGDVSSQFITGLLFALPLLWESSEIRLITPLESQSYVNLTLDVLRRFHIQAAWKDAHTLSVPGGQRYQPAVVSVEPDWSQGAFWFVANFLGSALRIDGMNFASVQGDRAVCSFYQQLAQPGDVTLDLSDCPDLLPPLAVMAAVRSGVTVFPHLHRLRYKESDRIAATVSMLRSLGAQAEELPEDGLRISGQAALPGGTVDGAGDHRIVMAAAIAAISCTGPVSILGAEAVEKSYPLFFEEYQRLGGEIHVL